MERILYFDCFSGISGDMSIGALVDLGLEPSDVVKEIQKLGVKGYEIEIKKTSRHAISGTDVKVTLAGEGPGAHDHHHDDHDHHSHEDHGHHHHGADRRNCAAAVQGRVLHAVHSGVVLVEGAVSRVVGSGARVRKRVVP